jgi:hypothetical protein
MRPKHALQPTAIGVYEPPRKRWTPVRKTCFTSDRTKLCNSWDTILYLTGRPMAGIKYGVPRILILEFFLVVLSNSFLEV